MIIMFLQASVPWSLIHIQQSPPAVTFTRYPCFHNPYWTLNQVQLADFNQTSDLPVNLLSTLQIFLCASVLKCMSLCVCLGLVCCCNSVLGSWHYPMWVQTWVLVCMAMLRCCRMSLFHFLFVCFSHTLFSAFRTVQPRKWMCWRTRSRTCGNAWRWRRSTTRRR